jgi:parallel beta-helix repeat protein
MVVTNCVIRNNQAFTGGHGVWMQGTGGSTAILANCSVYWNLGRGIYMVNASIVKNCVISNNFSGGIATGPTGMPLITNCVVITNICNGDGGGIYLLYGIIANCQIIANQMTNTAGNTYGGGVSIHNSYTAVILNSEIRNNFSAYMGGGIKLPGVTATMRNCLIAGNVAQSGGGGVYIYGAGNTLENCTIVSNRTLDTRGGGIYNACTNWMANSILYFNVVASGSGSNFYNSSGYPGSAGYCIYSNCCLSPALTGETTNYSVNNVTNDPQLVSRESGNFRLLPASPCINSGVNRDWMNGAVDLDSHSRLDHYSRIVDMGCFEYLPGGSMYSGF